MTEAVPAQGYPQQGPPPQQPYPAQQPPPYTTQQQPYPPQQQPYPPQQQPYPPQQQPYPPQQQPYPPQQQPYPAQQVIQQQPLPVKMTWTENPTVIACTNCKTQQTTVLRKKVGFMNWIVVGIVAFVLFDVLFWPCIPLAFIALCIDGLKDTEHVCPNCNYVNGVKRKV